MRHGYGWKNHRHRWSRLLLGMGAFLKKKKKKRFMTLFTDLDSGSCYGQTLPSDVLWLLCLKFPNVQIALLVT